MNLTLAEITAMTARNPAAREAVRKQLAPKATPAQPIADASRSAVSICLPWPPSVNDLWFTTKNRKRVCTPEYKSYKTSAAYVAQSVGVRPFHGPVDVTLHLHFPKAHGGHHSDTDSRAKAILDAMNGVLWRDDSQVRDLHNIRHDESEKPRVVVCVTPNVERRTA